MNKPQTIQHLIRDGVAGTKDVDTIARSLFDGKTTGAWIEGYVATAADWDSLPEPTKQFVRKAIGFFKVENVLDAKREPEAFSIDGNGEAECVSEPDEDDENFEPPTVGNEVL